MKIEFEINVKRFFLTFDPMRALDVRSVSRERALDERETGSSSGEILEDRGERRGPEKG